MKPLSIASAAAAAVVASALALGQDPAAQPKGTTTTTDTKSVAKEAAAPSALGAELKDVKSRASYLIGFQIGGGLKAQGLDIDPEILLRGIKEAQAGGKPALTEAEIQDTMKTLQQQAMAKQAEMQKTMQAEASKIGDANKKEGDAFLAANARKPGIVTTRSGLQYKVIKDGTGSSPKPTDLATVHYEGRLLSGEVFDSSYKKGEPVQFQPTGVIPGWTEALQLMKTGAQWELYIPSNLAYGPQGRPKIPPNSTLIFKVELLAVNGGK